MVVIAYLNVVADLQKGLRKPSLSSAPSVIIVVAMPIMAVRESLPPGIIGGATSEFPPVESSSPYRCLQAMTAGTRPKSSDIPKVPAESKAPKKMSGSTIAKSMGGNKTRANTAR